MAMKLYSDASVQAIANAIRTKNGASTQYKIADMAPAILAIPTGGSGGSVTQDEDGYIVLSPDAGGGSSPWVHLETITLSEDTRAINIDVSTYTSQYECLICYGDVYISPTDWIYIVKNGSSPSGGSYINGKKTHTTGIVFMIGRMIGNNAATSQFTGMFTNGVSMGSTATAATNFYIYAYNSASVMQAGSTFKIYGVNYADL